MTSEQNLTAEETQRITKFVCPICAKITAGRIGREKGLSGDTSHRYPRRHYYSGKPCEGNTMEAMWIDVDAKTKLPI